MLTRRFERLFRRLVSTFIAYDNAPRTPYRVAELAAARTQLDQIRSDIAAERSVMERRQQANAFRKTAVSDHDLAVLRIQGMIGS